MLTIGIQGVMEKPKTPAKTIMWDFALSSKSDLSQLQGED
jgi:hypothetical protein